MEKSRNVNTQWIIEDLLFVVMTSWNVMVVEKIHNNLEYKFSLELASVYVRVG